MISSREGKVTCSLQPALHNRSNYNGQSEWRKIPESSASWSKKYANYLKRKNVRVQVAIGWGFVIWLFQRWCVFLLTSAKQINVNAKQLLLCHTAINLIFLYQHLSQWKLIGTDSFSFAPVSHIFAIIPVWKRVCAVETSRWFSITTHLLRIVMSQSLKKWNHWTSLHQRYDQVVFFSISNFTDEQWPWSY